MDKKGCEWGSGGGLACWVFLVLIVLLMGSGCSMSGNGGNNGNSEDGCVWTEHDLPVQNGQNQLVYANGLFASVGEVGTILTSRDGQSWKKQENVRLPDGTEYINSLKDIVYTGSTFYVVGFEGFMARSQDGNDWEFIDDLYKIHGMGYTLQAIESNNATLTVAGSSPGSNVVNGYVYSIDSTGIGTEPWKEEPGIVMNHLFDLLRANNQFLLSGSGGTIMEKQDGAGWKLAGGGETFTLTSISYGNGRFVAVGTGGAVMSRLDGETEWKKQVSGVDVQLGKVVFAGGTFHAVGAMGTYLTSSDGETWERVPDVPFEQKPEFYINTYAQSDTMRVILTNGKAYTQCISGDDKG